MVGCSGDIRFGVGFVCANSGQTRQNYKQGCCHRVMIMRFMLVGAVVLALCGISEVDAEVDLYRLEIGDPERAGKDVPVVLDALTDSRSGELFAPGELAGKLAGVRLLFVGESHTSTQFHLAQLRVLQELHEAGRQVMIGLEMFPYTEQEYLDQWVDGLLTEQGFVEIASWYENWGYHWNYYRDIFLFARDNGIRMFAVNTPPDVVSAVREKGFKDLTEEEAAHIPDKIDTDSEQHLQLFKAYFEDEMFHHSMTDEQWKGMLNAQCTWDATMGYNAIQALKQHGKDEAIMVVLIGSGHVSYGLGIQRQAAHWFDGGMASIIPIPVLDEDDEPVERVQASYADFLWGLPQEVHTRYPELGVSSREDDETKERKVLYVAEDSAAERAGVELGDVVLSFDGVAIDDKGTFNRLIAAKRWGDASELKIRRGDEELTLQIQFRRQLPDDDEEESEASE